jgi:hypothetical protein
MSSDIRYLDGEFDPGSGRTLAACVTHASRTSAAMHEWRTGEEHVATNLALGNTRGKPWLIPHTPFGGKIYRCETGLRPIS